MTAPFLDVDDFALEYQGELGAGERLTAERLLQVVSDDIRSLLEAAGKPVNDNAATQVVFEVVRDQMAYGHLGPLSEFRNVTSRREESGKFAAGANSAEDYLTDRQLHLLGLPATASTAAPRGHFTPGDY
jgi:hypothetical protein